VGRTTRRTKGQVTDSNFRTSISYTDPQSGGVLGKAKFASLVLCTNYSQPGDSGALVLDNNNHAIGLHIGGTTAAARPWIKRSFFLPIQFVLDALNVELVTQPI
jgi:hypothetical protein